MNIISVPTPNFTKGRGRFHPEIIVLHITDGPDGSAELAFQNPDYQKSAHYLIKKSGQVIQFVSDENVAWANGIIDRPSSEIVIGHKFDNPNKFSLSIEIEAKNEDANDVQYNTCAELICLIAEKWTIPLDRKHILAHNEIKKSKRCCLPISVDKVLDLAIKRQLLDKALKIAANVPSVLTSEIYSEDIKINFGKKVVAFFTNLINYFHGKL